MSNDFCKTKCQTTTSERRFGLFDPEDSSPAIIKFDDDETWNAIVINSNSRTIIHTAIDNCIDIRRDNIDMDNRCDSMMTAGDMLILLELKNTRDSWQTDGLLQIEATIKRMKEENHSLLTTHKKKLAVVANRKHKYPAFSTSNKEQREYFMKEYKMRIQFESEVVIK